MIHRTDLAIELLQSKLAEKDYGEPVKKKQEVFQSTDLLLTPEEMQKRLARYMKNIPLPAWFIRD